MQWKNREREVEGGERERLEKQWENGSPWGENLYRRTTPTNCCDGWIQMDGTGIISAQSQADWCSTKGCSGPGLWKHYTTRIWASEPGQMANGFSSAVATLCVCKKWH